MISRITFACIIFLLCSYTTLLAQPGDSAEKTAAKNITVNAADEDIRKVLESVSIQSNIKTVVESTVKGKVTLSLNDTAVDFALNAICKSGKCNWRMIYISKDSDLLSQPDKLAATLRLMSGITFPDIVMAASSSGKQGMHYADKAMIAVAEKEVRANEKVQCVYVISNDAAVASKANKDKNDKERTEVEKYSDATKSLMEMFTKMSPEEQEQAIIAGINMMDQVDPSYMANAVRALVNVDPDALRRMQERQTNMLFSMSTDERRALLRLQFQMQTSMTPEQMQMLQEDVKAIQEEMKSNP